MKRYLGIYSIFFQTCLARAASFKAHFLLVIVMDLLFYAVSFASLLIIYEHVDTIGPWRKEQFLFFIAFMLTIDHAHMALVSENFWEFSAQIRRGTLDFELLKPVNTLFIIFLRQLRPETLLITPVPWIALYYYASAIDLSLPILLTLPVFIFYGLFFLVSIEILISMAMFITIESMALNFLRMQLQQVGRLPHFIYQGLFRKIFLFVIPILLIGSAPVEIALSGRPQLFFLSLLILAGLWIAIAICWRLGLRYYESASS